MKPIILRNGTIVNEGKTFVSDVLIRDQRIQKLDTAISFEGEHEEFDVSGKYILPGFIDDQVHFREPGLTHKGNIYSESRAAVAGGITSFMEMPNTVPNALTQELLADKYAIASKSAFANYSFFMGASNDNIEEVLKTNERNVCGVKIFMGSSTGNMLVDDTKVLNELFAKVPMLIATHCEDEATIRANIEHYRIIYGEEIPIELHPIIRSQEACYLSSSKAVEMAKKYGTRLHVLHISSEKELSLFDNSIPLAQKKITAEACIHHLWFSEEDYKTKGNFIKWNPAVKKASDRDAIWKAVLDDRIDVLATDHAPHTLEEKGNSYFRAPSGGPLVQHAMLAILEKCKQGAISLERAVEKMSHAPAELFRIEDRGYLREGYFADIVVVDPNKSLEVNKSNLLYHCGWSPFEGTRFSHSIEKTFINGRLAWNNGALIESNDNRTGMRLSFRV